MPLDLTAERRRDGVASVKHRNLTLAPGFDVFYREAGPPNAPVLLLLHGYPCSSFQYRHLMPRLASDYRLLSPDFPGFGYSSTPDDFRYDFDGYAAFLEDFVRALGVERCAIYLHDYGSQIGLRFAIAHPQRVTALIIQNGDIYEDQLGPKYDTLKAYWRCPTPEGRKVLERAVSEEGFRDEFIGEIECHLRERVSEDLWKLSWSLMNDKRREIMVSLMEGLRENLSWFPRYQAYLRSEQPPTLIVWGPQDGYMPEGAARAYLRDLPQAELYFVEGGHWALETNLEEVTARIRDFLPRALAHAPR